MSARTACLLMSCALSPAVLAAEPSLEELQQELNSLQARIARLDEANQPAIASQDVDATVAAVLRDAEQRSQLLQVEGTTAGWDQGRFLIRSADGNFVLIPSLVFQFRNTTNYSDDAKHGDAEMENGFEIRRMKQIFTGNVFTPNLTFKFMTETNRSTGAVFLQDAFVKYHFADDWSFRAGQFWDIPNHEDTMLEPLLLAADRSLVDALIVGGQDERVQGVSVIYEPKNPWRIEVLYHDGYNTDNTQYPDGLGGTSYLPGDLAWGSSTRIEYFAMGNRKNYDEFTALGTQEDLLVFGAGASFSQAGDNDVLYYTVDAQYENPNGFACFAETVGAWRQFGFGGTISNVDLFDWGFLVQASYLFKSNWEPFARFDYTALDDDSVPPGFGEDYPEVTVGVNRYFAGQKVRMCIDFTWLPNGSPSNQTQLGIIATDENEFVLRGQFQLIL